MYFAYVIQSLKDKSFYKGHCQNLSVRLKQHNEGKTKSIKIKTPYEIYYFETFNTLEEAIKREKYFKTATGRKFIKKMAP